MALSLLPKERRKDSKNIEFTLPLKPKVSVIFGIHIHLVVTAGKVKRKHEVSKVCQVSQ
jgi:hypothetical protein